MEHLHDTPYRKLCMQQKLALKTYAAANRLLAADLLDEVSITGKLWSGGGATCIVFGQSSWSA